VKRLNTKNAEEARADARFAKPARRRRAIGQICAGTGVDGGEVAKHGGLPSIVDEVLRRNPHRPAIWRRRLHEGDSRRVGKRERPQEYPVDDAEHRRRCTQRHRERKNGNDCERGRAAQGAERVADVLDENGHGSVEEDGFALRKDRTSGGRQQ